MRWRQYKVWYVKAAQRAHHRALAYALVVVALMNLAIWSLQPVGANHIAAGAILVLALSLCYFKYWKRRAPGA
jgi:hypothetical protein